MKKILCLAGLPLFLLKTACAQQRSTEIITTDIGNFWNAYDSITTTKDSTRQYYYLNTLFLEKATPAVAALMKARHATAKTFIDVINAYPRFWNSIRSNTLQADRFAGAIDENVQKLKEIYPELQPAQIYFTIGVLRSGGTTQGKMILIGSEMALAGPNTVLDELPATYQHPRSWFEHDLLKTIPFTNVHEYVHTQQKTTLTDNLLAQCVMEGVAEFVAVKATGMPSFAPAIAYGHANTEKVRQKFEAQLFNPGIGFWMYSDAANEFGVRDLGYYVGYAIAERYYDKAPDKKAAIRQMINLDYTDEIALAAYVDSSGYFNAPVKALKAQYESRRPTVIGIKPVKNNTDKINPAEKQITLEFSAPMDNRFRNFELGPLGKENALRPINGAFSDDGRTFTFNFDLQPGRHYQLEIGQGFRNLDGLHLIPYLIDFKTADQ